MESTIIYATLLYLMSFRLLIIGLGGMSIYLGYRLFVDAMGRRRKSSDNSVEMEAKFGDNQLTLRNAAPGIFFAAFGAGIVVVVLAGSPPEFSFTTSRGEVSSENGNITLADKTSPMMRSDWTLRAEEVPETAEMADKQAKQLFKEVFRLTAQAAKMEPDNADYQDSLAGLYFITGEFDLARQHQQKAAALAPERKDIQQRLAAYRHVGSLE